MSEPPAKLDYQTPQPEDERRARKHFVFGMVLAGLFVIAGVPLVIIAGLGASSNAPIWVFAGLGIALLGAGIGLAMRPTSRRFGAGLLTGVAVAVLIEGLCFLAVRR